MNNWTRSRWEIDKIDDITHIWVKFGGLYFNYAFDGYELRKLQIDLLGHHRATHRPDYVNPLASMQTVYVPIHSLNTIGINAELSSSTFGATEIDQSMLPSWAKP